MPELHRLLQRQLKRQLGAQFCVPAEWQGLVAAVNDAYEDFDTSRELLQRSLVLSSQELQQANAEMRAVFQAIPDLLFHLDPQGMILDFKAGTSDDLLLPSEAYRGRDFQKVPSQPLRRQFGESIRRVLASKTRVSLEYSLTLQGQERFYEARLVPLLDDQIVVMIRNITERRSAEAKLEAANLKLLETFRQAGASEVAASVLHKVGNALNSVNVSSNMLMERIQTSRLSGLGRAVTLMQAHAHDLPAFLTADPQGGKLLPYLAALAEHSAREQQEIATELGSLGQHVDHIKEIIAQQQRYAGVSGICGRLSAAELFEDALRTISGTMERHQIKLVRDFAEAPPLLLEKHKILQILVNLLYNADRACLESERHDKQVTLRVTAAAQSVRLAVTDNGVGIPPANLTRIFSHGFTTGKDRCRFGLHDGALAAKAMGGSLTASSAGPGQGATFVLELPSAANNP